MAGVAMIYAASGCVVGLFTFAINSYNAVSITKEVINEYYPKDQPFMDKYLTPIGPLIIFTPICICKSLFYGIFWPISTGVLIKRISVACRTNNVEWLSPFYIPGATCLRNATRQHKINEKYLIWPPNPEKE
jgi:hypothetical protein